jgi:hypothetical protein
MFARVTRFNIRPESLEQGHHQIEEHLIPALRMQKGYSGGFLLANREDHKMLAVGGRAKHARHRRGLSLV